MRIVAAMVVIAACGSEQSEPCPVELCDSCELGFFGPAAVPTDARLLRIESSSAYVSATVWLDGNELRVSALPSVIAIPDGTERVTVTTSRGAVVVRFAPCD